MKRTAEFTLGLIGGVFGIFFGLLSLLFGGVSAAFGMGNEVLWLGFSAILFSILGIIGASIVKHKTKMAGWFMTIAAVCGVISISAFYIIPGALLLVGGLMALIRKER
ncbi:DUF4064 domain-containing protein [Candidatus Woesearchaeota archaeon]|nr:DUF4064 domain-containing protein [Candidatus Woesearchaeota archaeon]